MCSLSLLSWPVFSSEVWQTHVRSVWSRGGLLIRACYCSVRAVMVWSRYYSQYSTLLGCFSNVSCVGEVLTEAAVSDETSSVRLMTANSGFSFRIPLLGCYLKPYVWHIRLSVYVEIESNLSGFEIHSRDVPFEWRLWTLSLALSVKIKYQAI